MVQPTGLEPVTSSFAGRRSNPTELRLHDADFIEYRAKAKVIMLEAYRSSQTP